MTRLEIHLTRCFCFGKSPNDIDGALVGEFNDCTGKGRSDHLQATMFMS